MFTAIDVPVNPLVTVLQSMKATPIPPPGHRTTSDQLRAAGEEYLTGLLSEVVTPPRYVYLKKGTKYLSRWGSDGLKWDKTSTDEYCVFETVRKQASTYYLKADTGLRFNAYSWTLSKGITASASADSRGLPFTLTRLPDDGSGEDRFYSYTTWDKQSAYMQGTNSSNKNAIASSTSANDNSIISFLPFVTSSSIESIVYTTSNPSLVPEPPFTDDFVLDNRGNDAPAQLGRTFRYGVSSVGRYVEISCDTFIVCSWPRVIAGPTPPDFQFPTKVPSR